MDTPLKVARNGVIEKVAWLHFDNRQVLFARTRGQTLAYTVGGKVDENETRDNAVVREAKEEADVDLIRESLKELYYFEGPCHGYVEGTILKMWCYAADYVGTLEPKAEIEELVYLGSKDIANNRTTEMGDTILRRLAADGYID